MTCADVLASEEFQTYAQNNSQFPCLLFSGSQCTGTRYPPIGGFNAWETSLTATDIGFSTIKSILIPPQITVQIWSPSMKNYYEAIGSQTIIDAQSQLAFWRNFDGTDCAASQSACGKAVHWTFGSDPQQLSSLKFHFTYFQGWNQLLYTSASNKQNLMIGSTEYSMNYDQFFAQLCANNPNNTYACQCHDAYFAIVTQHSAAADQSYVNLLQNGCDPSSQFVPTGANVGTGTDQECLNMINAQIQTGTFPTLSTKGSSQQYICNNQVYANAFNTGATNQTSYLSDEIEERYQVNSQIPIWILVGVLVFVIVMMMLYWLLQCPLAPKRLHPVRQRRLNEDWD